MSSKNGVNIGADKAPFYNIFVNFVFSDMTRIQIGEACAQFRVDYGWTQKQVQGVIKVDVAQLCKFEKGQVAKPERFYWFYIAKMLEMNDLSYLEDVFNVERE